MSFFDDAEGLINLIHAEVMRVMHRTTRRTPVKTDSYDPKTHSAKFKLMPESDVDDPVITGWIPLHTSQTGNKAGMYMPPNIGDHGWLEFSDDDREGGTFTHAAFNDKFPPDDTVKAGEHKYIHPATQTQIYFDNSGNVTIRGQNTSNSNGGNNNNGQGGGTNQDNSKQTIILKSDGSVVVKDKSGDATWTLDGNGNVTVNCKIYTVTASTKIVLDGMIYLGGADASLPAAMKGTLDDGGFKDVSNLSTKVLVK